MGIVSGPLSGVNRGEEVGVPVVEGAQGGRFDVAEALAAGDEAGGVSGVSAGCEADDGWGSELAEGAAVAVVGVGGEGGVQFGGGNGPGGFEVEDVAAVLRGEHGKGGGDVVSG
jgi:hypothetical protein